MTTTIYLPPQFVIDEIHPFLGRVVGPNGQPLDVHFIFDFRTLRFIDGTGFTAFCNVLDWLGRRGVKRQFQRPTGSPHGPLKYLDDCGFFRRYLGRDLSPNAGVRPSTLPCTQVPHVDGHAWLEHSMKPWLAGVLGVDPRALASINACVKELFNNVEDHSAEHIANIHLQHYPNLGKIHITVSDFGTGIPVNIRRVCGTMSDAAAISRATEAGITSKGNPNNQGQGLDLLITNVAGNHGSVSIYSQAGGITCRPGAGGQLDKALRQLDGNYPGTLVDIALRIDSFVGDEFDAEEDLVW